MGRLQARTKAFVEKALGVKIYRHPPGKHFYPELRRLRSWSPSDVVFDVGANDGRSALRLQKHLPPHTTFAFEPVAATYQTLVERTRHLERVRCFPLALGAERGQETMYISELDVMNSFSAGWSEAVGTETVEVATVDSVMAEHGVDFVHLLKVDAEGHDLEVLKGAEGALSGSRIGIIQVEVRFDKPGLDLHAFRSYLDPMGYRLYGIYNLARAQARLPAAWPDQRGFKAPRLLAYCDAVFVRVDPRGDEGKGKEEG